jgi:hypothetical protein
VASVTHDDTANYTLTATNGATDEARQMVLEIGGALTANRNAVVPTSEKLYLVKNSTSGGFSVVVKTGAGTGITVTNGETTLVYCDGTNVVTGIDFLPSLAVNGTLTLTGATIVNTGTITLPTATDTLVGRATTDTLTNKTITTPTIAGTWAFGSATVTGIDSSETYNIAHNPEFRIWQRGSTITGPSDGDYTADRWLWRQVGAGVVDVKRSTSVPDGNNEFSLEVDVTTADASIAATDYYGLEHRFEAFDTDILSFGESPSVTINVSFDVQATITGTHCVAFQNSAGNRHRIETYTIDVSNTWESKTISFTSDGSGTWVRGTNGIGLRAFFTLAAGSNFHGTAGSFAANNFRATSGQVNDLSSNSNLFRITNVKLEIGSSATAFRSRPMQQENAICRRYYQRYSESGGIGAAGAVRGASGVVSLTFDNSMRATPTLDKSGNGAFNVIDSSAGGVASTSIAINAASVSAATLSVAAPGMTDGNGMFVETNPSEWIAFLADL